MMGRARGRPLLVLTPAAPNRSKSVPWGRRRLSCLLLQGFAFGLFPSPWARSVTAPRPRASPPPPEPRQLPPPHPRGGRSAEPGSEQGLSAAAPRTPSPRPGPRARTPRSSPSLSAAPGPSDTLGIVPFGAEPPWGKVPGETPSRPSFHLLLDAAANGAFQGPEIFSHFLGGISAIT